MAEILGVQMPTIDITGILSSSWIYVFFVGVIGLVLIIALGIFLFFSTYNRKVIIFENIAGRGYQPTIRTRARVIRVQPTGVEVLKTLKGGEYLSAYGRRMGKNTYYFAKGPDGFLYNFILGDLDTKMAILDIEPVQEDVRMYHTAKNRLIEAQYGKKPNFLEKYGPTIVILIAMIILVVGLYIVSGKISEGLKATPEAAKINKETAELLNQMAIKLDNIQRGQAQIQSGLVPATSVQGGG